MRKRHFFPIREANDAMHCILYPLRINSHGMPMTTRKTLHLCLGLLVLLLQATASAQSSNPYTDGTASAPDEWLPMVEFFGHAICVTDRRVL